MNKDLRLYNVVEKNDETRFIVVKSGCYFSLTYNNIDSMENVIKIMKRRKRQETIKRLIGNIKSLFKK